jgi:hypothetical protein
MGTKFQSGWNAFADWQEKDDLILLRFPSGTFQILCVGKLSDVERTELRDLLTTVLPQKK